MNEKPQRGREPGSLEKRVHARYQQMPGSERALADLILEYPGDILLHTATSLSERAQVSKAAVTRFVRRLGFKDYREMQREVREAQMAGEPIYLNTALVTPAKAGDSLERHIEQDMENLRQTWKSVEASNIDEVVKRILSARRVWTLGFRNSYFFASYIRRQLIQVRPEVTLLPVPGQVLTEDLAGMGRDDLLIAVGLRRRTPQIRRIMELAHSRGVPIVYITDRRAVTTPKLASWTFACQVRGISLFDSYVGVISVLNYLCTEVAAEAGRPGRRRLKQIEDLMELAGEIDPDN